MSSQHVAAKACNLIFFNVRIRGRDYRFVVRYFGDTVHPEEIDFARGRRPVGVVQFIRITVSKFIQTRVIVQREASWMTLRIARLMFGGCKLLLVEFLLAATAAAVAG